MNKKHGKYKDISSVEVSDFIASIIEDSRRFVKETSPKPFVVNSVMGTPWF